MNLHARLGLAVSTMTRDERLRVGRAASPLGSFVAQVQTNLLGVDGARVRTGDCSAPYRPTTSGHDSNRLSRAAVASVYLGYLGIYLNWSLDQSTEGPPGLAT